MKYIKIFGHKYEIIVRDNSGEEGDFIARVFPAKCKILVEGKLCESRKHEALLHEIIEAVNNACELNLEHNAIQSLGESLYMILKEAKLLNLPELSNLTETDNTI